MKDSVDRWRIAFAFEKPLWKRQKLRSFTVTLNERNFLEKCLFFFFVLFSIGMSWMKRPSMSLNISDSPGPLVRFLSVCLSVWLSVRPSVCLSACLSCSLSCCLPVRLSAYPSICLSVCLPACLSFPPRATNLLFFQNCSFKMWD